jgi:hypothetical protein
LPQAAKYVRESYDALVDSFESIDNLLGRFKIYAMSYRWLLLVVLALATSMSIQVEIS